MQVHSTHEHRPSPALRPVRRLYKVYKRLPESPDGVAPLSGPSKSKSPEDDALGLARRGTLPGRSQTAYFVYLLIGVHHSHAEAKHAYARLDFAKSLPVTHERNENGNGKCKTWLAVSHPFHRRVYAEAAQRQLALFTGEGAVRVARGVVQ